MKTRNDIYNAVRPNTKVGQIMNILDQMEADDGATGIDATGSTGWINLQKFDELLFLKYGWKTSGNGNTHIQNDRGLGTYFHIEKDRDANRAGGFGYFRLAGYKPQRQTKHKATTKVDGPCAVCGSASNVQSDHKNGRHTQGEQHGYQPLCAACNARKRSVCKVCTATGRRFDATTIGYPETWTSGTENYNPKHGCAGCYWFDIADFRSNLIPARVLIKTAA